MKPRPRLKPLLSLAIVCFSKSWGGLEIMAARIAAALMARGHSVLVVSPAGSPLEAESQTRQIPHFALQPRLKYLDLKAAGILSSLFRRHAVQLVLATLSKDISTLVLARKLFSRTRLAYLQQMQFGHSKRDVFHRITYRELEVWITLTMRMKREVQENTIVPSERITVIPFGVDLSRFDPKRFSRRQARKRFRLPPDKLLIGIIGRLDKQKGHEDLLRAAPMVLKSVPKARFVIVGEETKGEPGYLAYIRELANELHISSKIRFMPFTKEIPLLLAGLDVLAVPSHSETFGYVAIEAMAMGVPVVGTNAGGLPEIVEDGKTGYLVPPKDPGALAKKLIDLLKSPSLRRSHSLEALKRASQRFDFESNVDALIQLLSKGPMDESRLRKAQGRGDE